MELVQTFTCDCNSRDYKSRANLKQHKKTNVHIQWENDKELRELKIELTKKDNKILELQTDKLNLQELNLILMKRINPQC